jgi:hypothetical protein
MDKKLRKLKEVVKELNEIDCYAFAMQPEKNKGFWKLEGRDIIFVEEKHGK